MSTLPKTLDQPEAPSAGWWARVDQWLDRASEKLNPILVKEARQALKSRQFVVTFALLLLCSLTWTFLGVATQMPGVYYRPSGPFMLVGYLVILTVPMLLIVPFSAYRSLAGEREDGTYEMLSITSLSARHIVTGKLGSAALQMLVYYSALSPCIAFTYLLRGIDILAIALLLVHTFWVSLLMSAFGLLVASLSRLRHVQALLSLAFLIGLLGVTIAWWSWTGWFAYDSSITATSGPETCVFALMITSVGVSYIVLFVLAAAAQLSFASDNRSTRVRVALLIQQTLFVGWMFYYWPGAHQLGVILAWLTVHWMIAGALMTGEWTQLSPRVRRGLPQSFLGRCLLTWFNPGSGTGYIFTVANLGALILLVVGVGGIGEAFGVIHSASPIWIRGIETPTLFGLLLWSYLTLYLGLGRLILLWLRRHVSLPVLMPLTIHGLLLAAGAVIPYVLQSWLLGFRGNVEYTALQIPNWYWTLGESGSRSPDVPVEAVIAIVALALLLLLINLAVAAREVEQVRQETPVRVQLDKLELRPPRVPAQTPPTSPFDDE